MSHAIYGPDGETLYTPDFQLLDRRWITDQEHDVKLDVMFEVNVRYPVHGHEEVSWVSPFDRHYRDLVEFAGGLTIGLDRSGQVAIVELSVHYDRLYDLSVDAFQAELSMHRWLVIPPDLLERVEYALSTRKIVGRLDDLCWQLWHRREVLFNDDDRHAYPRSS